MSQDDVDSEDSLIKIIADYVLALRGVATLSYRDYSIIAGWIEQSKNPDQLILVLGDLLPKAFSEDNSLSRNKFKSLNAINKKVQKSLNWE